MNSLSIRKNKSDKYEVIILAVIDCMKIKWHNIFIDKNTHGNDIYLYFKNYYNKYLTIDFDFNGKKYDLKKISNIINYLYDNPYRMCLYIHF